MAFCARWNWQRCHGTPVSRAVEASFSPAWSSLTTSVRRAARGPGAGQEVPPVDLGLGQRDADAQDDRWPCGSTPMAISTAQETTAPPWRTFS